MVLYPPSAIVQQDYRNLPYTKHADEEAPLLEEGEMSVLCWNVLRPPEDEAIAERKAVEAFEMWGAGGFKNGGLFLCDATFASFGEANLTRTLNGYTEKYLANALVKDPLTAEERADFLKQAYLGAIPQIDEYLKLGKAESTCRRCEHLSQEFKAKAENVGAILKKLRNESLPSLEQMAAQSLDRTTLPHNTWEGRRPALNRSMEQYLSRVGDRPYVIMMQEVTPKMLEAIAEDFRKINANREFQIIACGSKSGNPPAHFDPESTDPENREIGLVLIVSDKLRVLAQEVIALPQTQSAAAGQSDELKQASTEAERRAILFSHAPRRMLEAVLEERLTGKRFAVFTTHTDFRVSPLEYEKTARKINEVAEALQNQYPGIPMVLGGDMNMFAHIRNVQEYYSQLKDTFPQDFRDGKLYSPDELKNITFLDIPTADGNPGQFAPRIISGKGAETNALDQLLAKGVILSYGARHFGVWDPTTGKLASLSPKDRERYLELLKGGYYTSDHAGAEIVFRIGSP